MHRLVRDIFSNEESTRGASPVISWKAGLESWLVDERCRICRGLGRMRGQIRRCVNIFVSLEQVRKEVMITRFVHCNDEIILSNRFRAGSSINFKKDRSSNPFARKVGLSRRRKMRLDEMTFDFAFSSRVRFCCRFEATGPRVSRSRVSMETRSGKTNGEIFFLPRVSRVEKNRFSIEALSIYPFLAAGGNQ